jgi:hypothetical protein
MLLRIRTVILMRYVNAKMFTDVLILLELGDIVQATILFQ